MSKQQKLNLAGIAVILFLVPLMGHADRPIERVVVFGDSLSDSGNAFFLGGRNLEPPYTTLDPLLIPDAPYERGGNHFSNGLTWIEQFAEPLDLEDTVRPAFKGENTGELQMTNYAVGGARAHENGVNINLATQATAFFDDTDGAAPSNALYVIALGGNDVRDAVAALAFDPTGAASGAILNAALTAISDQIISLHTAGATKLMVGNAPDLSLTPAIRRLDLLQPGTGIAAAILSAQFNAGLEATLSQLSAVLPGLEIARLDLFGSLHELVADPQSAGLTNVVDACVIPDQEPAACKKPKRYLFWDGIHPTKVTHGVLAEKARAALNQLSITPE
ncbi:MAG: SGNH/GDSL hydrolase family protein [Candidatus Thiodiazotropha sp. (ex Monitilora ramsayi)]|nr:SGNH/GDSL hydrolase family protein [Candidatus Thiodiazotropha sp. (ex Monitilora ramsayi)]